jgi:hypothetical protein
MSYLNLLCQPVTIPSVDLESERARKKEVNTSSSLSDATTTREIEEGPGESGRLEIDRIV